MNTNRLGIVGRVARTLGLVFLVLSLGGCFLFGPPDTGGDTTDDGTSDGTGDGSSPGTTAPVVHVAGYADTYDGTLTTYHARSWAGGSATDVLSATYDAEGTGVGASESTVAVAGYYRNDDEDYYTAFQWVNGTVTDLSDGNDDAYPTKVFVDGSDVYVAGVNYTPTAYEAGYWINGTWTPLTTDDDGIAVDAKDITVVDGSVYAAGNDYTGGNGYRIPVTWTDGAKDTLILPTGTPEPVDDAVAWGIATDGNTVYAVGEAQQAVGSDKYAVLWEDGSPTVLNQSGTALAYASAVDAGVVHAVGYVDDNGSRAVHWTISGETVTETKLEESAPSGAYDIHITAGGSVYIAGYVNNSTETVAVYWLNGTRMELDTDYSYAYAIVVE